MKKLTLIALLLAACGGTPAPGSDAGPSDDAGPADAAPPLPPQRMELIGGGRMAGGSLVVDVQLGHPVASAPAIQP